MVGTRSLFLALLFAVFAVGGAPADTARYAELIDGDWEGEVQYDNSRFLPFKFSASILARGGDLSGEIIEPNTFARGRETELRSTLDGRLRSDGSVRFSKTYDGTGGQTHTVDYFGEFVTDSLIEGRWRVGRNAGSFWMERSDLSQ